MEELSNHARQRCKQRSISPAIVEWLAAFGTSLPAGDGAERLIFDKPARRRLARNLGRSIFNRIEEYLDAYVIRAIDGEIITSGWLTERVRR
jgi:hypothetical protein